MQNVNVCVLCVCSLGSSPAALSSQKSQPAMNVCPFPNELGKVCSQESKPLVSDWLLGRRTKHNNLWWVFSWDAGALAQLLGVLAGPEKCQLTALSVSRAKNISIRLSWGAVGLFNPAKDSVSRGFDAEWWVDVFKLNLSETERLEAGTWEREVNKMSFSERVEGFLGNSRISETAFWKPHPSSAPKTFSVPVTFTELSVKRGWLQQQIKVSKTS